MVFEVISNYVKTVDDLFSIVPRNLPVLDLGDRQGRTDYIDFLVPLDMKKELFKVPLNIQEFTDKFRRRGVAFHMVVKQEYENVPEGYEVVIAIFQRYTDSDYLSYGNGRSDDTIIKVLLAFHDTQVEHDGIMACNTCPVSGAHWNSVLLSDIIHGRHPYVGLK